MIDKEKLNRLLESNTLAEIAGIYNVSKSTISRLVKKFNLTRPNYGSHKLSLDEANRIRELHDSGKTQQELAREYQVTQATIGRIINNIYYKKNSLLGGQADIKIGYKV